MAIQTTDKMKDIVVKFEKGETYKFSKINKDPSVNEGRDAQQQIGAFTFEEVNSHKKIDIFPNQFHGAITIVERDGDSIKVLKRRNKYCGQFVTDFKSMREKSSTYDDLANQLNDFTFKVLQVWEHSEAVKGFSNGKPSNAWADANLNGFYSYQLGYDNEQIGADPID